MSTTNSTAKSKTTTIPPLQPGDHLTRPEFERRFDATPNLKIAELIDGIVYMPRFGVPATHGGAHFNLVAWLGIYKAATPSIEGGNNGHLRLDLDNMPQPDAFLRILESNGGQSRIDSDGYVQGAPELIAEVTYTSASYDLHDKLNVYCRHSAKEYIVWRVLDGAIDYFILNEGRYELLRPIKGIYRSRIFPGLWLDPAALIADDLVKVFATLQKGLATPQHVAFVGKLKKSGGLALLPQSNNTAPSTAVSTKSCPTPKNPSPFSSALPS